MCASACMCACVRACVCVLRCVSVCEEERESSYFQEAANTDQSNKRRRLLVFDTQPTAQVTSGQKREPERERNSRDSELVPVPPSQPSESLNHPPQNCLQPGNWFRNVVISRRLKTKQNLAKTTRTKMTTYTFHSELYVKFAEKL